MYVKSARKRSYSSVYLTKVNMQELRVRFAPAPGPLNNPLKGWCVYTDGPIYQPYSMVFRYVSWRDLEPREGEYRFAEWERKTWEVPQARGKHIILRVYADYPAMASGLPDRNGLYRPRRRKVTGL
jgi:hypothetical protein